MIRDVTDLEVYERSMKLLLPVYKLAKLLPKDEFRLKDQLTGAAKSVPALITEGFAKRKSDKEFKRYLYMALGSSDEVITHIRQIKLLPFKGIKSETCDVLIEHYKVVSKQINTMIKVWRSGNSSL